MTDTEASADERAARPRSVAIWALVLAWLVPGLGHFVLGRRRRAVAYAVILTFMFACAIALDGTLSRFGQGGLLSRLGTLADLGNGGLYLLARALDLGDGRVAAATHEVANAFHWSAGVMNMLLVLDVHDIAEGRK